MPATTLRLTRTSEAVVATAVNKAGAVLAEASSSLETRSPQPGWLEQRPEEWWDAVTGAISSLREKTSLTTITTIAIEGKFAASVFLDGEREVIRPAILEGDVRGPHPITWLRQHQPIAYKRVQHLLQPADYLRLMLTGEISTTRANAESTGLFDATLKAWDEHRCEDLEINVELLPPIRTGGARIRSDVAATLGVPAASMVV